MKSLELLKELKELKELKSTSEATIPSAYMSSDEEASVNGVIAAYSQAIQAIERLENGVPLNDVVLSIDNTLEHYLAYKQRNKEELKLDEDNYKIFDSIVHYIAAIDELGKLRELIIDLEKGVSI